MAIDPEVQKLARSIISEVAAARLLPAQARMTTLAAYSYAAAVIDAEREIASGSLSVTVKKEGPALAEFSAPNLPSSSPHNLVARMHTDKRGKQTPGNLDRVRKIYNWLLSNPTPDIADAFERKEKELQILQRLNDTFGVGWTLPEMHAAYAIFPAYCEGAKSVA